jgi:SAM-dependent methyltransferase
MIKSIKKNVRRLGHRFGLWNDWQSVTDREGLEKPSQWYDAAYSNINSYHVHYCQSCYYFSWTVIADRIVRANLTCVLEIGCGPGQFAALLRDQGIRTYTGLDFSPTAIQMAMKNAPEFTFIVDDAKTSDVYSTSDFDVIVCTEVLEHIEEDLMVVSRFPPGIRCICTVPNFPHDSHVRHFKSADDVKARYGVLFDSLSITTLKGSRTPSEEFFLFDGRRKTASE